MVNTRTIEMEIRFIKTGRLFHDQYGCDQSDWWDLNSLFEFAKK